MSNLMEIFNLQFFADTGEEGGAEGQPEGIKTDDEIDAESNSVFDKKSNLLQGGTFIDEDIPDGGDPDPAPEPEPEPEPVRVEPQVRQEDVEALRRLSPYAPFIGEIENDPDLARSVQDLIIARRRGGVPVEEPKAEDNKPPEQGDDESYDAYEERMEVWRKEQQQKLVDRRIHETLSLKEQERITAIHREAQQKVVEYTRADPRYQEVIDVVTAPAFPEPLRLAMDQDPRTFMMVYDTICNFQGRPGHFGAPVGNFTGGGAPVSNGATQQGGRTVVKERKPVPYAERGSATPEKRGGSGLPDFKSMSEAEFDAALERTRRKGF